MQLFQQSSVVERGGDRVRYGPERVDVYSGAIFSNLMSIFIIIATAATLHAIGKNNIDTAADAARALEPVAGHFAGVIFAVGLVERLFWPRRCYRWQRVMRSAKPLVFPKELASISAERHFSSLYSLA
jgi:Mn2+ and Fe2+ transporters of the NRAMP family